MLPELAKHSEKLLYFYEIATVGSLQATSRKLGISAPSLSYSMKQLEAVIGSPLFHRSKSGVKTTEAGDALYSFCRRFYRSMEEVQSQIDHPQKKSVQRIRIGTFQSIAMYLWPSLMTAMKVSPQISLSITTGRSRRILEALLRHEVDIALTVECVQHERIIKHETHTDDYSFFGPRNSKASVTTKELINKTLLYIPDAMDRSGMSLRQHLHAWDLKFAEEFELDSLEVVAEFIKKGYGIGILPNRVARTHGGALQRLNLQKVPGIKFGAHRFFLSYRNDLDISAALVETLLLATRQAAKNQS